VIVATVAEPVAMRIGVDQGLLEAATGADDQQDPRDRRQRAADRPGELVPVHPGRQAEQDDRRDHADEQCDDRLARHLQGGPHAVAVRQGHLGDGADQHQDDRDEDDDHRRTTPTRPRRCSSGASAGTSAFPSGATSGAVTGTHRTASFANSGPATSTVGIAVARPNSRVRPGFAPSASIATSGARVGRDEPVQHRQPRECRDPHRDDRQPQPPRHQHHDRPSTAAPAISARNGWTSS
jgi:hypothetical protein